MADEPRGARDHEREESATSRPPSSSYAGNRSTSTGFVNPARLLVTQDGFAWVADTRANKFAKYDLKGKLLTTFGTGGVLGSFPGALNAPHDFSVDTEGNLYVASTFNFTVDKFVPKKNGDRRRLIGQPYKAGT